MTITEVRKYCEEVADRFGFDISDYPIIENKRLKTTLGQVRFRQDVFEIQQIEFASFLLAEATDRCVKETILHELAHVFVFLETYEQHGHDAEFKAMCARIGLEDARSFGNVEYKNQIAVEKPKSKYSIYCTKCGKLVAARHRRCPVVDRPETFTANCCGAPVKCIMNW